MYNIFYKDFHQKWLNLKDFSPWRCKIQLPGKLIYDQLPGKFHHSGKWPDKWGVTECTTLVQINESSLKQKPT